MPRISCTRPWTRLRVRLSLKERRMKCHGTHETPQEIGDVGHPIFCCRYRMPVISLPTRFSESAARDDTGRANDRFSAAPTALGSSSGSISQPFRAGLTFGGRPSGPCIYGDLCRVISPSTCRRQVSCSHGTLHGEPDRRGRRDDKGEDNAFMKELLAHPGKPVRCTRSWKRGSERRGSKPGRINTPGLNRSV